MAFPPPYPVDVDNITEHAHGSDQWIDTNLYGPTQLSGAESVDTRYLVVVDNNNGSFANSPTRHMLHVYKSLDQGVTWVAKDDSNAIPIKYQTSPPNANPERNIAKSILDSTSGILYILHFRQETDETYGFLDVARFQTNSGNLSGGSADTWLTTITGGADMAVPSHGSQVPIREEDKNPVGNQVNGLAASIAKRDSDNSLHVFFNGDSELISGTYYNRCYTTRTVLGSGVWSAAELLPDQLAVEKDYYAWFVLTTPLSDIPHFFWLYTTREGVVPPNDDVELYHAAITPGNTFNPVDTVATKTDLWTLGITGSRIVVSGQPYTANGFIYLPVFGNDGSGNPPAQLNPPFRIIKSSSDNHNPSWSFLPDVTTGGPVTQGTPDDLGEIHDTTAMFLSYLTDTGDLYAFWCTGGGIFYKFTSDEVSWSVTQTLIEIDGANYYWLMLGGGVTSGRIGLYFSQDQEFVWWPISYAEIGFAAGDLNIDCASPPNGAVGVAYSHQVSVTGGTPPYTVTLFAGALPTGLSVSSSGLISGTPSAAGVFGFTLEVEDDVGATDFAECSITITDVLLGCGSPPDGEVGIAYSNFLTVSGGTGPYTYSITVGALPTGLTLNVSTGEISGTPTVAGSFSFTAHVEDSLGATDDVECQIDIIAAVVLDCNSPSDGTVGIIYTHQLTFTGGIIPTTYTLVGGALPTGLTLNSLTAVISGTPTAAGTFTFTIRVTDSVGAIDDVECQIVIDSASIYLPYRLQIFDDGEGMYLFDSNVDHRLASGNQASPGNRGQWGPFVLDSPKAVSPTGLLTIEITNTIVQGLPKDPHNGAMLADFVIIFATPKQQKNAEESAQYGGATLPIMEQNTDFYPGGEGEEES